jgi:hypothetical protein
MVMSVENKLFALAEAIRYKTGKSEKLSLSAMTQAAYDDAVIEDGLIDGTISNYTNKRLNTLKGYAFYNNQNLTSINIPECTKIGENAF